MAHEQSGPAEPATPLRGFVDVVEATRIAGWAHDPADPARALVIELCEGGVVLARTVANVLRPDLRDAGVGTGLYGFSITFGPRLFPLARHVLQVRFAETGLDLTGSPAVLEPPGRGDAMDAAAIGSVLARRLPAVATPEELGGYVAVLAEALDLAFAQKERVGRPVIAPPPPRAAPSGAAPASFREAVAQVQERYPDLRWDAVRKPLVSVVIVSRDQFPEAHACIAALVKAPPRAECEIILVDDESSDEALVARSVLPGSIRLFRTPRRVGPVKALRAGQALAQGRYVLFLDPRARLARGAVDAMVAAFEADPAAGIVGAALDGPDGRQQAGGLGIMLSGDLVPLGAGREPGDPEASFVRDVDAVLSHALMVEKALWTRVGGVDDDYTDAVHADADLCLRARRAGRRVLVTPFARATLEITPETLAPEAGFEERSRFHEGRQRLKTLWGTELEGPRHADADPERHGAARRALVIDHAYPTPHLDAGSGAMLSHIRALQGLGYHVSFVPGGPPEPHPTATPMLQALGVRCYHAPYAGSPIDVLEAKGGEFDIVYIHRYPNAAGYLEAVRRLAPQARVVYSVADLHYLREERQAELAGDEALKAESADHRAGELAAVAAADAVVTHSDVEAELIRQAVPEARVHVVPWTTEARPVTRPFAERSGIAFVGSYAHEPNRDAARWLVEEIMPLVHKEDPDITLHLVGAGLPEDLARDRAGIRAVGWVENLHDDVFSRVRLTVAPLRFGAGLKGKVIESLASGVPCIMTSCAAEGLPRMTQILGWTVNGAEGFARAIIAAHKGQGTTNEGIDEVRQSIAAFTDARAVMSALSEALSPPSPQVEDQQSAAPAHAQRE